jgi:hypothetical protein
MELKDIEKEILVGNVLPHRLAELRLQLSAKFSVATDNLEEILIQKPRIWNGIRESQKSDTATERIWEATELGTEERHWRFQIKKIEKMMTACKTMIDVMNSEARNLM